MKIYNKYNKELNHLGYAHAEPLQWAYKEQQEILKKHKNTRV